MSNSVEFINKQKFHQRRIWAKAAWIYFTLLLIATVMLGTFFVAFLASLKDDALKEPGDLNFAQIQPANWIAAAHLGDQGANSILFGGFAPGAKITFEVTYAIEDGDTFTTPEIVIPRRAAGSGMAAIAYPHFAADYAQLSAPIRINTQENVQYEQLRGINKTIKHGSSTTWRFQISYVGQGPKVAHLPLDITTPNSHVLVGSTLAPSRFERRGRVASWVNVSPGFIGYTFASYVRVWNESISIDTGESLFWSWTVNSFFIALGKMILTVLVACSGGYALARINFRGSRFVFLMLIVSMTVPMQVSFISNYEVFNSLNLLNTPWAIIGMLIASAQVLIMKQFFESFPKELEEAAIVDGASPPIILLRIFMPLAKPAIATVAILAFQGTWNDFFWPLVVLTTPPDAYTLPVGLLSLRNSYGVAGDWNLILAGSFMSTLPVLILFILFQRYFVGNNMSSAVKG